jgi:exodeoxyribonuclease V beta subunit
MVEALFNQLTHEFLDFAQIELPKRKARTNTVTYDDLITGLRDALRQKERRARPRHRRQFPAALIDEFQDTDPAQYEIFRTIFLEKSSPLPDRRSGQAIYGFRGADVFTYFQATRLPINLYAATNWRSEAPL